MPEISRFYGIVIKMFYNDHAPPHFHAEHGERRAIVAIDSLGLVAGGLSPRATGLVMEWATLHRDELRRVWQQARNFDPPRLRGLVAGDNANDDSFGHGSDSEKTDSYVVVRRSPRLWPGAAFAGS